MNNEETVTTENEGVDCTQYPDCIPVAAPAQIRRIYPPVSARNTAVCYTRTSAVLVFPPSRSSSFISMFRSVRRDDHTVKLNVHRMCVHIRKNRRRLLYTSKYLFDLAPELERGSFTQPLQQSLQSLQPLTEQVDRVHRSSLGQGGDVLPPVVRVTAESVDKHHRGAVASLLHRGGGSGAGAGGIKGRGT